MIGTIITVFACDVVSFATIQTVKSKVITPQLKRAVELRVVAAQHAAREYANTVAKRYVR